MHAFHQGESAGRVPVLSRRAFVGFLVAGANVLGVRGGRCVRSATRAFAIDADFPGGNIIVERIEGDRAWVRQDLRDTSTWWFYWYFRVRGAGGRTVQFNFTNRSVFTSGGPCCSIDGGQTWRWLGFDPAHDTSFEFAFPPDADDVRFCLAVPYVEANLREFLKPRRSSPSLIVETHCVSRRGRRVERLRLGRLDGDARHRVALTCRHHACEMMASWVLEGLMAAVVEDQGHGAWLRRHVEFAVFPFMDKDGVEDGDQGKNRRPHDHNRDYMGQLIYPSVRAIKEFLPVWSAGRLRIALDLHCPYLRGGRHEVIHFVGIPDEQVAAQTDRFSRILEEVNDSPLPYRARNNLPFGQEWNTLREPRMFSRWVATIPGVRVASTLEFPYARASGREVTAETARAFGQSLSRAIARYLRELDESEG